MLDPALVQLVAADLDAEEGLIEKDFHMVRALAVIAGMDHAGAQAAFSGGTSLSKGWALIKRFSEDLDFKIAQPPAPSKTAAHKFRSGYRERFLAAMENAGFALAKPPRIGDDATYVNAVFDYGAQYPTAATLRSELRIELTFDEPALAPSMRAVQSFFGLAAKHSPEVPALLCIDPVETAADKLGALAWRTYVRDRSRPADDPTVVRHLHDLAVLEPIASSSDAFIELARRTLKVDALRAKIAGLDAMVMLTAMLPKISGDPEWRAEYARFVRNVAYGPDAERIAFERALTSCERLVKAVVQE